METRHWPQDNEKDRKDQDISTVQSYLDLESFCFNGKIIEISLSHFPANAIFSEYDSHVASSGI